MAVQLRTHRFSVEDFQRMAASGILDGRQHVELVEGSVVEMAPIGSEHTAVVNLVALAFFRRFASSAIVQVKGSVAISDVSQLQPDLALLKLRDDFHRTALPVASEIHLVLEVADSSLRYDRGVKSILYAAAGIPELWLVDCLAEELECHRNPGPRGFENVQRFGRGSSLAPLAFPNESIPVDKILGPAG